MWEHGQVEEEAVVSLLVLLAALAACAGEASGSGEGTQGAVAAAAKHLGSACRREDGR